MTTSPICLNENFPQRPATEEAFNTPKLAASINRTMDVMTMLKDFESLSDLIGFILYLVEVIEGDADFFGADQAPYTLPEASHVPAQPDVR